MQKKKDEFDFELFAAYLAEDIEPYTIKEILI